MPHATFVDHTTAGAFAPIQSAGLGSPRLVRLPILLIAIFFGFLVFPRVRASDHIVWSFVAIGSGLLLWQLLLWQLARRHGRTLQIEAVPPVRQHYIQGCVQCCVYGYWGFYWPPIYTQAPLILSQLVFVFAFEALFSWSRGRAWRLTSGPVPIVLSTNLFIWFVDTWLALQFAMIVVGLLGKEFLKWRKDGRVTHIFNPSGFGLLVTVIALIATRTTDELTMARPLANTIDQPPHIFLVLFGLGLVVQRFFAVTLMTLCAVAVTVAVTLGYHAWTGVHLFTASNMPAAGFLGMHLLMTDPSTSPKTNLGRALFGAGYGLGYSALFHLLGQGNLELYAKLFPVPILNLAVRRLDRIASSGLFGRWNRTWETALTPARMNLVHMGIWVALFASMWGSGYLSQPHEGASLAFWKQAYREGKPEAARKLATLAIGTASPDSFNEMGLLSLDPEFMRLPSTRDRPPPEYWFAEGIARGSRHAVRNLVLQYLYMEQVPPGQTLSIALEQVRRETEAKPGGTSSLLLAYACETGRGMPRDPGRALKLYRACGNEDALAGKGIARLALSANGEFVDVAVILPTLHQGADAGDPESCFYLAHLHRVGRGVAREEATARHLLQRACDLGLQAACAALRQDPLPPFAPLEAEHTARPAWSTAFPP